MSVCNRKLLSTILHKMSENINFTFKTKDVTTSSTTKWKLRDIYKFRPVGVCTVPFICTRFWFSGRTRRRSFKDCPDSSPGLQMSSSNAFAYQWNEGNDSLLSFSDGLTVMPKVLFINRHWDIDVRTSLKIVTKISYHKREINLSSFFFIFGLKRKL